MTTERRQPKREPLLRVSALELRLYIAAFLAAVYAISWRAIGGHAATTEPALVTEPIAVEPQPQFVWLGSMAPAVRPTIALPAGWEIASERSRSPSSSASSASSLRPQVVRAPKHRVPRVRTRSS